jgi:hypothetical protein
VTWAVFDRYSAVAGCEFCRNKSRSHPLGAVLGCAEERCNCLEQIALQKPSGLGIGFALVIEID